MKKITFMFTAILIFIYSTQSFTQIKKENLMRTVNFLASKELAGRLPGSDGYIKAANFVADELNKLNIKPCGDEKYFQKLKVEYNEILAPEHFSIIYNNDKTDYNLGQDYVYRGFTGAGKFSAQVVFSGYGLSQPEFNYDDYSGIDVVGKVVMVFKYNPKWNVDGKNFTNGNPREKAIVAAKHGAIGILFVSFPNDAEPQAPIGSVIHGDGEQMNNFPELHVDLSVADKLFSGCGYKLKDLQTKIDSTKKPFSISLIPIVDLEVHTNYYKEKEVFNVVGLIEGIDPLLKNEFIIVGAHLDHVGSQAGKIFFPGANDNASGSAALLEIARAFANQKEKPKRSIIFSFFASEEQGLYGSTFLSKHLPIGKEKAKAMINLDCIGYGDSIQVGGGESAPALYNMVKNIDKENNKLLVPRTWKGGGADAEPFYQLGIPTLYFVTTNSYKHLHLLSDKPETLNLNLFEATTRLAYLTIKKINEQP